MPTLFQFPSGGALTIADSDVFYFGQNGTEYQLPFSSIKEVFGNVQAASLSIPTASVLTLFATPLEIVAAPSSGYAIQVVSASCLITYNSVAYATNTRLQLITDTASVGQTQGTSTILAATTTRTSHINNTIEPTAGQTQIIAAKSLKVQVMTGNPTAGNSDIKVYVLYRIITL
mgnify:CR=1 FL=1